LLQHGLQFEVDYRLTYTEVETYNSKTKKISQSVIVALLPTKSLWAHAPCALKFIPVLPK